MKPIKTTGQDQPEKKQEYKGRQKSHIIPGTIGVEEDLKVIGSTPFVKFDGSKISIMDKDSTFVDFTSAFDSITNTYALSFDKTDDNAYKMQILPEAFVGFFDKVNDTINISLSTKKASDFGFARFTLLNATFPLIIQLTDKSGKVQYEEYATNDNPVDFLNLSPSTYLIRVIHDTNGNQKFDTGNYLKKLQPEKVSYFDEIEIRADWGYPETLEFTE